MRFSQINNGIYPLFIALRTANVDVAKLLLSVANVEDVLFNSIMMFFVDGNIEMAEDILQYPSNDVNIVMVVSNILAFQIASFCSIEHLQPFEMLRY